MKLFSLKKGVEFTEFMGWAIAIIVLFVVIAIGYRLLSQGGIGAYSFGSGVLPGKEPPELLGEVEIPRSLESDFDILVSNINKAKDTDSCLVSTSELKASEGWSILLSEGKAELFKESEREGQPTLKKTAILNNFNPCELKEDAAVNFYNCYLKEGTKTCEALSPKTEQIRLGIDEKLKFLYKSGDKFCKFTFYNDVEADFWSSDCDPPKDNGKEGTDNDCIDDIKEKIVKCGEKAKYPFMGNLIAKGYSEEFRTAAAEFLDAVTQAANSNKDVCRVEFERYPGFDNQKITMFDVNGNLQIQADGKNKDSVILQTIPNYKPCIVHGQNFWGWLWNADAAAKINQYIDKSWVSITQSGNNHVMFSPQDSQGKTERDVYKDRPLIYKTVDSAGDKHICIMHRWNQGQCKKDTSDRNAVATRCLEKKNPDYLESTGRTPLC